ncbi:polysaccharide pyruvyl transferase family protein [Loigolactobacillus zhaoyuanensis]
MKKVIVDGYFTNNLGDDLFLKVLAERFPHVELVILSDKKYADIYHQINKLKVINKNFLVKVINRYVNFIPSRLIPKLLSYSADAYLEIGGSIFQQVNVSDGVTVKRKNILKSGIPYFIIGSNFGPVMTQEYIDEYRSFFACIKNITVRDSASYELFDNLNNIQLAPDVVFGLDASNISKSYLNRPYIVITAIDLTYDGRVLGEKYKSDSKGYRQNMVKLCELIIDSGYDIKLVPFSVFEQDANMALQIKMGISNKKKAKIEIIKYTNISDILSLIKSASGIVSGRYHSMILGWVFRIPQLVLTYSDKMENTITDTFPEQKRVTIKKFSEKSIFKTFTLNEYMNTIDNDNLKSSIHRSKLHFEKLSNFLNNDSLN